MRNSSEVSGKQDLTSDLSRMIDHWRARGSDFELYVTIKHAPITSHIRQPSKESHRVIILVHFDEEESLLDNETRARFYAKQVLLPDLRRLLDAGYQVKVDDPRLQQSHLRARSLSAESLDKIIDIWGFVVRTESTLSLTIEDHSL